MEVELLKKYGSVSPGKIENLDGTTETVDFRFSTAIRFYRNMEDADFPLHWHAPGEIISPIEGTYTVTIAGKTVTLANNIDLNNEKWTPIGIYGTQATWFKGTFDGQNHAVTGLKVEESRKNGVGFFSKVYTGTIKNLTVEGSVSASNCNYVGGIVGQLEPEVLQTFSEDFLDKLLAQLDTLQDIMDRTANHADSISDSVHAQMSDLTGKVRDTKDIAKELTDAMTDWANGNIGYFPSYAIGSAYGAQYLLEMQKDFDVFEAVRSGKLTKINGWMEEKIWKYGCMKDPTPLFESVCGKFDPTRYTAYLREKLTEVYGL